MRSFLGLLVIIIAPSVFATGSFSCGGTAADGSKVRISACVPHGIAGLCSDLNVSVNGKTEMTIPRAQIPSFYSSKNFTGLIGYDSDINFILVSLEFFGKNNSKNKLVVKLAEKEIKVREVKCEFE